MRWKRSGVPTPSEAARLQREWSARVVLEGDGSIPRTVAGVDVGVKDERARAAVCVFTWPALEFVESATAQREVEFPYVPGLLGFREVPCVVDALTKLGARPDLLIVDGHGRAHPRRFGVATHLGVTVGLPALGCAKSLLVGAFREPGPRRGASTRLVHGGEVVGRVLRTREGVKPVFVSIGHRIDLETAVRIVLRAARGFRLPEPIRAAHRAAAVGG